MKEKQPTGMSPRERCRFDFFFANPVLSKACFSPSETQDATGVVPCWNGQWSRAHPAAELKLKHGFSDARALPVLVEATDAYEEYTSKWGLSQTVFAYDNEKRAGCVHF
jgi:hypothetical protein